MKYPVLLTAGAVTLGAAWLPSPAQSCVSFTPALQASYPERDAVDVPTNAVLFVYGPELDAGDDVTLIEVASNEPVPVEVRRTAPEGLDLIPLSELQPYRRYLLRPSVPLEESWSLISFTTGSGPAAIPDALLPPDLTAVQLRYPWSTCGDTGTLCVEGAPAPGTTLEVRNGSRVSSGYASSPQALYREYGELLDADECLEFRVRDVRGHRSAPTTLCGNDLKQVQLPDVYELSSGSICESYEGILADESACSVSQPGGARSRYGWLLAGLAAFLTARRRLRPTAR